MCSACYLTKKNIYLLKSSQTLRQHRLMQDIPGPYVNSTLQFQEIYVTLYVLYMFVIGQTFLQTTVIVYYNIYA